MTPELQQAIEECRKRVTAKKPKPITIAGHKVLATKGAVEIDDTVYANSTIRAIAEKLID